MLSHFSRVWLCDPLDGSLPGSSVHGILCARILKWVVMPISEDLSNAGIKLGSPALQADSLPPEPLGKPAFKYNLLQMKTSTDPWAVRHKLWSVEQAVAGWIHALHWITWNLFQQDQIWAPLALGVEVELIREHFQNLRDSCDFKIQKNWKQGDRNNSRHLENLKKAWSRRGWEA